MSESFDPYFQWLGIRDAQRPLDYYRLLGLPPLTSDRKVIAAAARQTLERVERFRHSRHAERAGKLVEEIEAARRCLLEEPSKAAYDDRLRRAEASWPPGTEPPSGSKPVVPPPPAGGAGRSKPARPKPPTAATPQVRPAVSSSKSKASAGRPAGHAEPATPMTLRRPKRPVLGVWPWIAGVAVVVVMGVGVAYLVFGPERVAQSNASPVEDRDPVPRDESPVWTQPQPSIAPARIAPESPPEEGPVEEPPQQGAPPQQAAAPTEGGSQESPTEFWDEVAADPDAPPPWEMDLPRLPSRDRMPAKAPGSSAVIGLIRDAYQALAERNLNEAERLLHRAAGRASNQVDKAEVRRLETMVLLNQRFWRGVERQASTAGPEHTFAFGSSLYHGPRVTQIESSSRKVRLRDRNGNEQQFSTQPGTIDVRLALGLAERDLAGSGAAGLSVLAGFLAVDREGDAAMAAQAWQQASRQAWPIDALAETAKFDFSELAVGNRPVLPSGNESDFFVSGPPWEVPTSDELRTARRELISQFGEALSEAKARPEMAELSDQILAAGTTAESSALRYAHYAEAQRLAIEAADPERLFAAVDALAAEFQVDGQQEKMQSLGRLTREQLTGAEAASVLAFIEKQIEQSAAEEQFDEAMTLATLAERFAERRGGSGGQVAAARLSQRQRWLRRQQDEQEAANAARQRLRSAPEEPEANQALGWYLCVFLGDWEAGLPLLAQAEDAELKSLAERELSPPEDAQGRFELGKAWLSVASRYANDTAIQVLLGQRAAYWIADARPSLPAALQQEAEQLLVAIRTTASGEDAPPAAAMMQAVMGRRWHFVWEPNPASNHTLADGFQYRFLEFLPDGTCRTNRNEGRWQLEGDVITVVYAEKPSWREYYRLTARGLEGEHYDPPEEFVVRGRGTVITE